MLTSEARRAERAEVLKGASGGFLKGFERRSPVQAGAPEEVYGGGVDLID